VARNRVIAEWSALNPLLEAAGINLVCIESPREQSADERTHADTGDAVDRDPGRRQLLEHTDVRERASSSAGEDDAG
jgi:hypothetical protein